MPPESNTCDPAANKQASKLNTIGMRSTTVPIDHISKAAPDPVRIPGLYGHNPQQNNLLAKLSASEYERLLPQLEFVALPFDMAICEAEEYMSHVYFPTSSIISIRYNTTDGASLEIAIIGNEGLVGVNAFMGGGTNFSQAIVKCAGYGFRIAANTMANEFSRGGMLQQLFLRYTQALIAQMAQGVVCNRHHSVGQQLCRLLLLTLDRLPSNEMNMTQESIAKTLGVRRESIAEAAGTLQEKGVIHYSRGHILVLDRAGLESRACECYASVEKEYDRLLNSSVTPEASEHL